MRPLSVVTLNIVSLFFYSSNLFAQSTIDENKPPVEFGCQFHATAYLGRPSQTILAPSTSDYLDLMAKAQVLERQLFHPDITNGLWTEGRARVLLNLAQVKQSVGDTAEARELYENALYNMRINGGVFSLDQIPVVLDLMASYLLEDDEFADQLGDSAFYTHYDDFGQLVETPEAGVDQVSRSTGAVLVEVQSLLRPPDSQSQAGNERAKQLLDELHKKYDELQYVDRAGL